MPTNDTLQTQIDFLDNLSQINKEKKVVFELRDYQKEAVELGVKHLLYGRKPGILIEPSGSGKSLIIGVIAGELNGHVIIFQPSKELLMQNLSKFKMYHPNIDVGIYSASFNSKEIHKVTFCTIGSVFRKPELFQNFEYIIVDEADYGMNVYGDSMYKKFFTAIGKKPCLGLTATPYRLCHNSFGCCLRFITRTSPRIFNSVVHYTQIKDLLDKGFLAECKYYSVKNNFDTNKLVVNATGSDYTDASIKRHYKEISFDNSVLDICKRLINVNRKNILVFTKFVEEAEILVRELGGDVANVVSADTPSKERDQMITDFRSGRLRVLANVGIMVTGVDIPELETVVLASAMRSLRMFYQKIGRCMRPHPLKDCSWVIDLCQNLQRFPPVDRLHLCKDNAGQWHYIDSQTKKALTNVYFN